MDAYSRLINFYDFGLKGRTKARGINGDLSSPKSLPQLLLEIEAVRELNQARAKYKSGSPKQIKLEYIEDRGTFWIILLNLVDTSANDIVTNELDGGEESRQTVQFDDNRGLESSCHLVIMKQAQETGRHLVLCEKVTAFPFVLIVNFLNKMALKASQLFKDSYMAPRPDDPRLQMKKYCQITYSAHPSDEFFEDLEQGKLKGIQLISDVEVLKGCERGDQYPELTKTDVHMRVRKRDIITSGGNLGHFNKAIQYADSLRMPYVRVSFDDLTGAYRTAKISSDTGRIMEGDFYVKKRKVDDFEVRLKTAYPVVHEPLIEKMLELLE